MTSPRATGDSLAQLGPTPAALWLVPYQEAALAQFMGGGGSQLDRLSEFSHSVVLAAEPHTGPHAAQEGSPRGAGTPGRPRPTERVPSGLSGTSGSRARLSGHHVTSPGSPRSSRPLGRGHCCCPQSGGEPEAQKVKGAARGHSWHAAEQCGSSSQAHVALEAEVCPRADRGISSAAPDHHLAGPALGPCFQRQGQAAGQLGHAGAWPRPSPRTASQGTSCRWRPA